MWLYIPSACALGEAGLIWDSNSPVPEPSHLSFTSSGKPMQRRSWRRAWKTKAFLRRLSGLTLEPCIAQRSAITFAKQLAGRGWGSCSAAFLANHTQLPADSLAQTILAIYGRRCIDSLRRTHQYSRCSSRMSQGCLLPGEPAVLSKTWSDWVSRLRAASLLRRKSAPPTGGSGCSSWQTAIPPDSPKTRRQVGGTERENLLPAEAEMWHTPNVPNRGPETKQSKAKRPEAGGIDLQTEAKLWNTPHGMGNTDRTGKLGGAGGGEFAKQANQWPTPAGRDVKGTNDPSHLDRSTGSKRLDRLPNYVSHCFPLAPQTSTLGGESSESTPASPPPSWATPAGADAIGSTGGTTEKGGGKCLRKDASRFVGTTKRRLSPRFVEWLMGWPRDFTQCSIARDGSDFLGMASCPSKQPQPSSASRPYCSMVKRWKWRMMAHLKMLICQEASND